MTILGTRPEIIRLSLIIPLLDRHCEHVLVHTGQNFDRLLGDVFFEELGLRQPDLHLAVRGETFGEQAGQILTRIEPILREHRPDRVIILGDTNSGLSAIIARRLGIPVFHMEAGNRCYDFRVPEELNRRIIDHASSVLLPYTQRSRENLLREGLAGEKIFVTGNPIYEVMKHFDPQISRSPILSTLQLQPGKYFLVTMHRAENVDVPERLRLFVKVFESLHREYGFPVVGSLHPRTRARASEIGVNLDIPGLRFGGPYGFFDFMRLEKSAFCVLTDSGTVQEETCILKIPNVTIRDVTERPETIDCGSNVLTGCDHERILEAVRSVTSRPPAWQPPAEYMAENVASTVCGIALSALG